MHPVCVNGLVVEKSPDKTSHWLDPYKQGLVLDTTCSNFTVTLSQWGPTFLAVMPYISFTPNPFTFLVCYSAFCSLFYLLLCCLSPHCSAVCHTQQLSVPLWHVRHRLATHAVSYAPVPAVPKAAEDLQSASLTFPMLEAMIEDGTVLQCYLCATQGLFLNQKSINGAV